MFKTGDRVKSKDTGLVRRSREVAKGETGTVSRVEDGQYVYFIADKDGEEVCRMYMYLSLIEEDKKERFRIGERIEFMGRVGYYGGIDTYGTPFAEMEKPSGWNRDITIPESYKSSFSNTYLYVKEEEPWKKVEEEKEEVKSTQKIGREPSTEVTFTYIKGSLQAYEEMTGTYLREWMGFKSKYEGVEEMPKEIMFKKRTNKRRNLL